MPADPDPLFVLTGPTASGKSEVGLVLAERLETEIISADSVQVYRHFDIGSAKPSGGQLKRVRHHLISVVDPDEEFNVASYRDLAGKIARELWAENKVPLVVGGSGLYIKGLTEGLNCAVHISKEVNGELDAIFKKEGQEGMYRRVEAADPDWAARVHPNDTYRTRRALGVFITSGRTMSQTFAENPNKPAFDALVLALDLPRDVLYRRIDRRIEEMLASGWRKEIRRLKEMGYNDSTKPMRSVGYRILYKESTGAIDSETAYRAILKDTKAFARRQLTWLRKAPNALFIHVGQGDTAEQIAESILMRDEVIKFLARRQIHL